MCVLCLIFQNMTVFFFSWKALLDLYCLGALSKTNHGPLRIINRVDNMKKLKRNIKWPKNNLEQRHQLCLNDIALGLDQIKPREK